jgi:hypothetical protein
MQALEPVRRLIERMLPWPSHRAVLELEEELTTWDERPVFEAVSEASTGD